MATSLSQKLAPLLLLFFVALAHAGWTQLGSSQNTTIDLRPQQRASHVSVLLNYTTIDATNISSVRDDIQMITIGGISNRSTTSYRDAWLLHILPNDTNTWSLLYNATFPVRYGHSATLYNSSGNYTIPPLSNATLPNQILVFGGKDNGTNTLYNDVWQLTFNVTDSSNVSAVWARLSDGTGLAPQSRFFHAASESKAGAGFFIFGGTNGTTTFGDLWRYDKVPNIWNNISLTASRPDGRFGHTLTPYNANSQFLMFGGCNSTTAFNDLWIFYQLTGTTVTVAKRTPLGGPAPRCFHSTVYVEGQGILVFGGRSANGTVYNDLWFYSTLYNIWAQIDNGRGIAPQARFGHSAVVVHDDGLLIFGGNVNNGTSVTNDMWVYRVSSSPPTPETTTGKSNSTKPFFPTESRTRKINTYITGYMVIIGLVSVVVGVAILYRKQGK